MYTQVLINITFYCRTLSAIYVLSVSDIQSVVCCSGKELWYDIKKAVREVK